MDTFDARAVDEYFSPRHGSWQFRDFGTLNLEGQCFPGLIGKRIGAQYGFDNGAKQSQDTVVVNRVDTDQCAIHVAHRAGRRLRPITLESGIMQGMEQQDHRCGNIGRLSQSFDNRYQAIA